MTRLFVSQLRAIFYLLSRGPPTHYTFASLFPKHYMALANAAGAASARVYLSSARKDCFLPEEDRHPADSRRLLLINICGAFKCAQRISDPGAFMIARINGRAEPLQNLNFWRRAIDLMAPIASVLQLLVSSAEDHCMKKHEALGFSGRLDKIEGLLDRNAFILTIQDPSEDMILQINDAPYPERYIKDADLQLSSAHSLLGPLSTQKLSITASESSSRIISQLRGKRDEIKLKLMPEPEFCRCDILLQDIPAGAALGNPFWARNQE